MDLIKNHQGLGSSTPVPVANGAKDAGTKGPKAGWPARDEGDLKLQIQRRERCASLRKLDNRNREEGDFVLFGAAPKATSKANMSTTRALATNT